MAAAVFLSTLSGCEPTPPGGPTPLDGHWLGSYISTTTVGLNGVDCTNGYGGFTVVNGVLSGEATNPYGVSYTVTGRVVGSDRVDGHFSYQGHIAGEFQGKLEGDRLAGKFGDAENCRGDWTAIRE